VVIFFADGMDAQRLQEMLDAGLLPNIRRTFVEGGVRVRYAISSMPSITYPNCSSIITGLFPGHHGIMGNYWLDRDRLLIHYYMTFDTARNVNGDLAPPTIYDMLSDRLTVSILVQTHKGVTESIDLKDVFDLGWVLGRYQWVNQRVGETFLKVVELANRVRRWPAVVMTYYPGVDEIGHRFGPDSSEYAQVFTQLDRTVGTITGQVETLGLGRSTYYALIADHGMAPIRSGQDFDFIQWLRDERRIEVLNSPLDKPDYAGRFAAMQKYDAAATVDAGRVAMIHLRGRAGWTHRPDGEEAYHWAHMEPAIHELPAAGMVAARGGPDRVVVWSRKGMLEVERKVEDGRKLYRAGAPEGAPLACSDTPNLARFAAAGWHESREWLEATSGARYPDLVPQVVEMFDSPHTGDLVVFAAEGWLLYAGEKAGHGSTLYRDMHVPMFFAGPDLPAGTQIPLARIVDLVPTLVGLLGEAHRLEDFPPLDGIDLSAQLRAASPIQEDLPAPTPARRLPQ